MTAQRDVAKPARAYPTLTEATRVWARIGLLSFGGPAGQIALMHRILVQERRWLGEKRFLHALNYCMVLPGPEAMQLAIYVGWLMHRIPGGLIAGTLFVLPGVVSIMALSWLYALFGNLGTIEALFFGLKAAVLAIVIQALVRISSKALHDRVMILIAVMSFLAIFALSMPFPVIILVAALAGFLSGLFLGKGRRDGPPEHAAASVQDDGETLLGAAMPAHARMTVGHALRVAAVFLLLWLGPVLALFLVLGDEHVFARIAGFFSVLAVVTFGGAYAVLAYMAQEAVQNFGWLAPGEMLDGLGMAETTPGPLIMVTQFVGFMAGFRDAGALSPLAAGTLGGLLATWVTFLPCFLWIFLGAPFSERLRDNALIGAALSGITAAVVGVILNLAVWFGLNVVFADMRRFAGFGLSLEVPVLTSMDLTAAFLVVSVTIVAFLLRPGPVLILSGSVLAGFALRFLGF